MPGYWKRSPEPYILDAYTSKGEFLWSYNMGWSIETGTWYSPYMVYDIDGNGLAEVYAKAGEGDPREGISISFTAQEAKDCQIRIWVHSHQGLSGGMLMN